MDLPDTLAEIDQFQADDQRALHRASTRPTSTSSSCTRRRVKAMRGGQGRRSKSQAADGPVTLKTAEVVQISGDIMGQIYARDFKMVDQTRHDRQPRPRTAQRQARPLSSGVERELHHAFEGGKEVYVVWACRGMPSPFITETATRVFKSTDEAIEYFKQKGYIK